MTDMARSTADISSEAQSIVMPNVSDLPEYDYGLNISFNQDTLDKLDLDEDVQVGDFIHLHAFAKVTSISQPPGADKPDRISLVMTHICCAEDEDQENETDGE